MGSIVRVKAWDGDSARWMIMYERVPADSTVAVYHELTNLYHLFNPTLCEPAFKTRHVRLELDTRTVEDWNELDYARLRGATTLRRGVLQASPSQNASVIYEPNAHFHGADSFEVSAYDCAYTAERSSDATVTVMLAA